jgi:HPt (histidine-containing phosphotransfer) domain-containing protein
MLNRNEPRQSPAETDAAAGAGGSPAVLDAEALDRLRALDPDGRADILLRVLGIYEGSLKRLMAQFDGARSTQDLPVLRHVAHTLRSSSASIGALELSRRCLDVEIRIREGRTADLSGALEAMALESERAAAAVRAMLDRPGSPA